MNSSNFSLVISIISLLISTGLAIYKIYDTKKMDKAKMETEYFDSLYKDYLLIKLPKARAKMLFGQDYKLIGSQELTQLLNDIRQDSLYFMYSDSIFYNDLKCQLQNLEDYIVSHEDKSLIAEEQTEFLSNIQKKLTNIYELMLKKHNGKNKKSKIYLIKKIKKILCTH